MDMRYVEIAGYGGPEVLRSATGPAPVAAPGEVLVRVRAAGVNRPDIVQRQGFYPPPPGASAIPGLEVAGEVVALGAGAGRWRVGDAVCALVSGGGYAEYVNVPAGQVLPVPRGLTMEQAAALPETAFTVWHNLFERGGLRAGDRVLIHGGSSGIGTLAVQLGVAHGARVMVTAGSAEKCAACIALGAERAVNYREEDFVAAAREFSDGRGIDLILDMVGGEYLQRNVRCAAEDGRIVQIAFLQGANVSLDLMPLMLKRLTLTGSTLRARPVAFKSALAGAVERHVWPLVESARVRVVLDRVFPLEQAATAHALMESSAHVGKIVLSV
jgi:putative PIG3 family NAD(P)H quinone oxidoreductase